MEGLDLTAGDQALGYYRGRSVFVTGHTGFKGSWLTLWLHSLGAEVHGYALPPPTTPSNFELSRVAECCANSHLGDVRSFEEFSAALAASRAEVVLHLAAQPLVREGYRKPRETFDINVMGTVNLLEAIRREGRPRAVVVVTSDKCYENREQIWGYRECDPLGGESPYSASKGAAEIVVDAYRRSFFPPERLAQHGIRVASARAGNVIGGGDWAPDRIVTDLVRALCAGESVPVRNPRAVRPWQHVLEPLSGYLLLGQRLATSTDPRWCSGWNFGPATADAVPVARLVELFLETWGSGSWADRSDPDAPPEAGVLRLAIDKAVTDLGWKPRWSVEEAVRRTATWYRAYRDGGAGLRARCLTDISEYLAAGQGL